MDFILMDILLNKVDELKKEEILSENLRTKEMINYTIDQLSDIIFQFERETK